MKILKLKSGGRLVLGNTPHGRFRVEWDAQGRLVSEWIEIREPASAKEAAPGVGDHMHTLMQARYGIPACQRCVEMIDRMNALGPDGCRREHDALLDEMWSRRDQLEGWRKIVAKLPGTECAAKWELSNLLDEAIGRSEG